MAADLSSLHMILKDPTRRSILTILNERGSLSYVEILGLLEIEHTGKLNYHLKLLGDLISKDENGRYSLTEKGKLATQVISRFQPAPRQGSLAALRISRTGLGKLLLVLTIPSFILSLLPLSQDYLLASRISFILGVLTILLLVFGLIHLVPSSRSMDGFSSRRQLMAYGALELLFLTVIFFLSLLGGFGSLPLISESNGNAFLVYLAVLPGALTWLAIAVRHTIHNLSEALKVPLVATGFLLIGELVIVSVAALLLGFRGSYPEVNQMAYQVMVMINLPLIAFIFIGVLIAECAYRLVEWNGRKGEMSNPLRIRKR